MEEKAGEGEKDRWNRGGNGMEWRVDGGARRGGRRRKILWRLLEGFSCHNLHAPLHTT